MLKFFAKIHRIFIEKYYTYGEKRIIDKIPKGIEVEELYLYGKK